MLYLDSSALVKRYVQEEGSKAVASRFVRGETIYTSMLSFAEVHAAIGRKFRDKQLSVNEKKKLVDEFLYDWLFSLTVLELTTHTMIALPTLCEQYSLKASDAIHLSAAIWLKDSVRVHAKGLEGSGSTVEFGVSDRQLGEAALKCGFQVFNPA
jgi:predicted nucleic acid-binding protein